jgi:hypothetical protein
MGLDKEILAIWLARQGVKATTTPKMRGILLRARCNRFIGGISPSGRKSL